MLINILKGSFVFQNIASWLASMVPSVVSHNLEKYSALKKALYLTALEQLEGDYLEFGVFTGSSFVFALRMHRKLRYLGKTSTQFLGFDSFSGFGKISEEEKHPFYLDDIFSVNAQKVIKNIKRHAKGIETNIIQGYFQDTLKGKPASEYGVKKARVVFIDCDLKEPSALVLNFVKPCLQQGTILVMDDFYSYKGDSTKGVAGAFEEFTRQNPQFHWRQIFNYGFGGVGFILSRTGVEAQIRPERTLDSLPFQN